MLKKICYTSDKHNKETLESTSFLYSVGIPVSQHTILIRGGKVLQERCQGARLRLVVVLAHLRLQELCNIQKPPSVAPDVS